ncbi:MAG: PAS domain-containing protein, partial [Planctomycetes bacterium]|nr:PAS domain-containing protein [Planctomycetota bacterium]
MNRERDRISIQETPFLSQLCDSTGVALLAVDRQLQVFYANQRAVELLAGAQDCCAGVPLREVIQAEYEHRWPVVVRVGQALQQRQRKLLVERDDAKPRNCVLALDWFHAMTKAMDGSWHVIVNPHATHVPHGVLSVASQILPEYLRDLCQRGLNLDRWENPLDSFAEEILRDLARFVDDRYGNGEEVMAAMDVLWPSREHGHPLAFADLLARLVRNDELGIDEEGYSGQKPALVRVPEVDGLFLAYTTFAKLLKNHRVPVPRMMQVTAMLAHNKWLSENRE